jgi:hypothetical protein
MDDTVHQRAAAGPRHAKNRGEPGQSSCEHAGPPGWSPVLEGGARCFLWPRRAHLATGSAAGRGDQDALTGLPRVLFAERAGSRTRPGATRSRCGRVRRLERLQGSKDTLATTWQRPPARGGEPAQAILRLAEPGHATPQHRAPGRRRLTMPGRLAAVCPPTSWPKTARRGGA